MLMRRLPGVYLRGMWSWLYVRAAVCVLMAGSLLVLSFPQYAPGAFGLVCLPTYFKIELSRRLGRYASQYSSVGRKRQRNISQVVHPHPRCDGYRRHLSYLYCPLSDNVAAQHPTSLTVDDQFAEAHLAPINYRTRGRVETHNRNHPVVCLAGLRFGEAFLGILRVSGATDRTHWVPHRHRRSSHSVGSSHKAVLYRLRNQHEATGNVPGGKNVGRRGP